MTDSSSDDSDHMSEYESDSDEDPNYDENIKTMKLMAGTKNFNELHDYHMKWLNGEIGGYHYQCFATVDKLDGDSEFINLLRHVSASLPMVTTNSQPSLRIMQDNMDEPVGVYCVPGEFDPYDAFDNIEVCYRPYITGYVTMETFRKIFMVDQTDLIIIGHLPEGNTDIKWIDDLAKYNITQFTPNHNLYSKNIVFKVKYGDSGVCLTKFKFNKNGEVKSAYACGVWPHNYKTKCTNNPCHCVDAEPEEYTWQQRELFEITIIHKDYGVDAKIFDHLVKDLCTKVNK